MPEETCEVFTLSNGVEIPRIMMGTYSIFGDQAKDLFAAGYEIGYSAVDCGRYYKNEPDWGNAIKASGIKREDVFIQTKVDHAAEREGLDVKGDFEITLRNFSTDYIDCLLIHWPNLNTLATTWAAMEDLYEEGKLRAIGVSNFRIEHFEILSRTANILPMVLQIERHPCRKQQELYAYCRAHGIQLQAYQPLAVARPELMNNPLLKRIAETHNCTVPQVALAWNLNTGVIPLPRSRNASRMAENFEALELSLSTEEIREIDSDKAHYFRALKEASEYPGYWDEIHRVEIDKYL